MGRVLVFCLRMRLRIRRVMCSMEEWGKKEVSLTLWKRERVGTLVEETVKLVGRQVWRFLVRRRGVIGRVVSLLYSFALKTYGGFITKQCRGVYTCIRSYCID